MDFDFTTVPNRKNTGSYKWICTENGNEFENAFPLSTADMEWSTPPQIKKACSDWALNGYYCYTVADEKYRKVVCDFMDRRHNWKIEPDWITTTYGIVSAIHTCVRAFTKKGEGVIIQSPVYGHFGAAVTLNDRKLINNSLILKDGKFEIDFEELEKQCSDINTKMIIFCSPHNPVGRVWKREEIERLVDVCYRNNVLIVSDEIHFDITSKPHTVLASISEKAASISITMTAASKTFNIAGLGTSNIIISNPKIRETFQKRIEKDGYECINSFAYPAYLAAYTECDEWLDKMNENLKENYSVFKKYISENIPQIKQYELEGTYLVWLDVSCLNIPDDKIVEYFAKKANLVVNSGGWFGKEGLGFIRLNIALPKDKLLECLENLKKAF